MNTGYGAFRLDPGYLFYIDQGMIPPPGEVELMLRIPEGEEFHGLEVHFQDVTGGDLREEVQTGLDQEGILLRCEEIIISNVQNEREAYISAMWSLASNMTAKEISESLGMDVNRGTALVMDLKKMLRKARSMGRFSDLLS